MNPRVAPLNCIDVPVRWRRWTREIPEVGTLTSDGVLRLSIECATACGHHLVEGSEIDGRASAARERVRCAAQRAADELGTSVLVTGTWDGRHTWTVHMSRPETAASLSLDQR